MMYEIRVGQFHFWLDKESFITPTWVAAYGGYMHFSDTLFNLIKSVIFEYKDDRHIVG